MYNIAILGILIKMFNNLNLKSVKLKGWIVWLSNPSSLPQHPCVPRACVVTTGRVLKCPPGPWSVTVREGGVGSSARSPPVSRADHLQKQTY